MSFKDVYLVGEKTARTTGLDLELAADFLKGLPTGYGEFLKELGPGVYCDFLRVWHPKALRERTEGFREIANEWLEAFSEFGSEPVPELDFVNAHCIAGSIDGDYLVVCPEAPTEIYAFPRHDDSIYILPEGLFDPLKWLRLNKPEHDYAMSLPFRYFDSQINRSIIHLFSNGALSFQKTVSQTRCFWNPTHEVAESREEGADKVTRVFSKDIYGQVYIAQCENDPRIHMTISYDRDFESEVNEGVASLEGEGFAVVNRQILSG